MVIELHDQKLEVARQFFGQICGMVKSITWQVKRATIKTIDPQNGVRPKNYRIWMGQMIKKKVGFWGTLFSDKPIQCIPHLKSIWVTIVCQERDALLHVKNDQGLWSFGFESCDRYPSTNFYSKCSDLNTQIHRNTLIVATFWPNCAHVWQEINTCPGWKWGNNGPIKFVMNCNTLFVRSHYPENSWSKAIWGWFPF